MLNAPGDTRPNVLRGLGSPRQPCPPFWKTPGSSPQNVVRSDKGIEVRRGRPHPLSTFGAFRLCGSSMRSSTWKQHEVSCIEGRQCVKPTRMKLGRRGQDSPDPRVRCCSFPLAISPRWPVGHTRQSSPLLACGADHGRTREVCPFLWGTGRRRKQGHLDSACGKARVKTKDEPQHSDDDFREFTAGHHGPCHCPTSRRTHAEALAQLAHLACEAASTARSPSWPKWLRVVELTSTRVESCAPTESSRHCAMTRPRNHASS